MKRTVQQKLLQNELDRILREQRDIIRELTRASSDMDAIKGQIAEREQHLQDLGVKVADIRKQIATSRASAKQERQSAINRVRHLCKNLGVDYDLEDGVVHLYAPDGFLWAGGLVSRICDNWEQALELMAPMSVDQFIEDPEAERKES